MLSNNVKIFIVPISLATMTRRAMTAKQIDGIDAAHATAAATTKLLRDCGFAWTRATEFRPLLPDSALANWPSFAASWNDLGVDTYMADGGRYRRRRFSAFAVSSNAIVLKPHQPHYQSQDYNPLNGGIERWFLPFKNELADHPILQAILRVCYAIFNELASTDSPPLVWHVECHQFRIEAKHNQQGQPTPEGLHRDGVDWVLVMLVARENIAEGVTTIYDASKRPLGSFTLATAFDAAFVDDSRVYHGVTAVKPIDPQRAAYRDVLVVTFRRG
jgi:hypothetical protein